MTTQQHSIDQYFPTEPWLHRYRDALEADEELSEVGEGWGVDWQGAMVFEITDVPVDERTIEDLPDELSGLVEERIDSFETAELEAFLEDAPADVRESVEARDGDLRDRIIAEIRETNLQEAPDRVWPELQAEFPDLVSELFDQLEANLSDDTTVYSWLDVYNGGCRDVAVIDGPDEREHGFVLTSEYETWRRLVRGDENVVNLIMSGEMELEGDMQKLLEYTEAATVLVDIASDLDSQFIL